MANPKPLRIGAAIEQFPAGTFNALVAGEVRDRARLREPAPSRSGAVLLPILLTETVAAATFTAADNKISPTEFTAKRLYFGGNDVDLLYDDDATVDGLSYYMTAVTVSTGKARVAWLINRRLVVADCTEITL